MQGQSLCDQSAAGEAEARGARNLNVVHQGRGVVGQQPSGAGAGRDGGAARAAIILANAMGRACPLSGRRPGSQGRRPASGQRGAVECPA
jgi:hypothetical protein